MTETTPRPNLIWVFGDQHRAQAQGHMGDPNLHTPAIDRLAAEGLTVTSAVSGSPLCCPARGSLLTGRYPHHCVPGHEYPLPQGQQTVAHVFKESGYRTAYFGKWHLDGFKEREGRAAMHIVPPERRGGFDHWIAYENNNSPWDCWVHGGEGKEAFHYRLPGFETDDLTDLFIAYLKEQTPGGVPFFAVLSVQPPHDPYAAPGEWMRNHTPGAVSLRPNVPTVPRVADRATRELAGYYSAIENLDWNLSRIRSSLQETGLTDETHIVFFSDHGDLHGSHGQFRKAAPWEEAIRVPCILAGGVPQYGGRTSRVSIPLNHVDLAPTSLGLCGIDTPCWMEGTDYSANRRADRRRASEPDSAFLQLVVPTGHHDSVDRPWRGVVTRDGWKYCVLEHQPWLMFDLREDPYEAVNLAHETRYASQRRTLQERLAAWIHDTGDDFPLPVL
jgi:arylsulfatase A-like enzyme